jgi:hypothetical protein
MSAKTPRFPKDPPELPTKADWDALQATAAFLERARLAEFVAIMNNPA